MIVKKHGDVPVHALPGIRHRTLAGPADGLRGMEIWYQRVAPGAETPWHRHDCEEAVVILQGSGDSAIEVRPVWGTTRTRRWREA